MVQPSLHPPAVDAGHQRVVGLAGRRQPHVRARVARARRSPSTSSSRSAPRSCRSRRPQARSGRSAVRGRRRAPRWRSVGLVDANLAGLSDAKRARSRPKRSEARPPARVNTCADAEDRVALDVPLSSVSRRAGASDPVAVGRDDPWHRVTSCGAHPDNLAVGGGHPGGAVDDDVEAPVEVEVCQRRPARAPRSASVSSSGPGARARPRGPSPRCRPAPAERSCSHARVASRRLRYRARRL